MDEIEVNYERAPRMVLCPMDGAPLKAMRRALNEPSVFEHRDGTSHQDGLAQLLAAKLPKPELPKIPRLSEEFWNSWSVTMEAAGKACREFGDAIRAAYPSIQKNMAGAAKVVQPLAQKRSDDE